MPETRLQFRPGIDIELSPTAQRGGWTQGNLIRWREGFPEKLRGWAQLLADAPAGLCRSLHYFTDPIVGTVRVAAGTTSNLQIVIDNVLYDITPAGYVTGKASSAGVPYSLRIWVLDNWGTSLIAIASVGAAYVWVPPVPATLPPPRATVILNSPSLNQGGFVAMPEQILVVYGCSPAPAPNMTQDAMLVRWSAQADYTDWIASATNQAGSYRLPRGNRIIGGKQTPLGGLIWTDIDVWMMQYIGFPLVFGFTEILANCGLLAENAVAILGGDVYWMSDHGFFHASGMGGATQIPCPVWDFVYLDLDTANQDKCFAGTDYHYSEISFFFPSISGGTGEIDSYVKFNIAENAWDTGRLVRTAWTDINRPGPPLAVDRAGLIQQHDTGFDNNGLAMSGVSIRSGFTDLGDGHDMIFVDRFMPDQMFESSPGVTPSYNLTLLFRNFPGDINQTIGPFTITPTTEYITLRARGREVAIQIDCNILGTWFRLGVPRLRIAKDGTL